MAYNRPTLPALLTRCINAIFAAMPGTDPQLQRQVSTAVGAAMGMELNLEYGYIDYIFQQFFVSSATGQYLDDKGIPLGILREPGTIAAGSVAGVGGTAGDTLDVGTLMQTADQSVTCTVAALATVADDGTVTVSVTTTVPEAAGNLPAGTILNLIIADAGLPASFTVSAPGLSGGADVELDEDYKPRILARMQLLPQGGANRDYISWTKNGVAGVTRVWVYPLYQGLGTVGVAAVFDGRAPGASIIPTTEDLVALQAAIAPGPVAPVCAAPLAFALTPNVIDVVIGNLVPVTGFTQAQALANATASLAALFALSTPGGAAAGDGVTGTPTTPVSGTTFLEDISDAITQSLGVGSFDLAAPTADVVSAFANIAQLGAVTAP
jgi:uncharacterized phage protein gp47/JayE